MRRFLLGLLLVSAIAVGIAVGGGSTFTAKAAATGVGARPSQLHFGRVTVGTPSRYKKVTFVNHTSQDLLLNGSVTDAAAPAGFSFATQGCWSMLPGSTCTSEMVFEPQSAGTVSGSWTITFDDLNGNPYTVTAKVVGAGL